jgi:prepilin-type processing-associated H-X9-DG protein
VANWRVRIFPYLEQGSLYSQLNLADVYDDVHLQNLVLAVWKCPSATVPDLQPASWVTWWTDNHHQVPAYIGIMGAYPDPAGRTTGVTLATNYGGQWSANGMLLTNQALTMVMCTDGTSNTIIVAEQSGMIGNADLRNGYYTPWGSATFTTPLAATAAGTDMWGMGLTCVQYVINPTTTASGDATSYQANTALNSNHPGGINVLFTDGTVRFAVNSTDFLNFQKLCVRDDGFPTSDPS